MQFSTVEIATKRQLMNQLRQPTWLTELTLERQITSQAAGISSKPKKAISVPVWQNGMVAVVAINS